ncbi:cell wall-binding repeat-containing protein [Specibacter sp. RAF43]|uniref:cell wall-binding repeat-containing protein n=1 Tax=Specibacter sp. RAF43 TaxID=3233057 RepID=UPI003F9DFC60
MTPLAVSIENGAATVTVSVHLIDDTGASDPTIAMSHASGHSLGFGPMALQSGDARDGIWERSVTVPPGSAIGSWTVRLYPLSDTLGNLSDSFRDLANITVTAGADKPFLTSIPKIYGTAIIGKVLNAQASGWLPGVDSFEYQWFRDGNVITGATDSSYLVATADFGKKLSVSATGKRSGYLTTTRTSLQTARVGKGPTLSYRLSGADRYATAAAVARSGYPATAKVVYVATGSDYPDALSAAPAAAREGGPLLLTMPTSLPAATASEIKRLKPSKVVVVGGTGAVSAAVFDAVKKIVPNAVRRSGANRFETSRAILAGAFSQSSTAYLATGMDYPDALSASASAGAAGAPVLLVNGKAKDLDAATRAALVTLKVGKTIIAGGTGVFSPGLEQSLKAFGSQRRSGSDRFGTSQRLNAELAKNAGQVYLATGYGFPDALAGSAIAGAQKAPLYVVKPNCIPAGILGDITASPATRVTLLGGFGALGDNVAGLKAC